MSKASESFVKAMEDKTKHYTDSTLLKLLQNATDSHSIYSKSSAEANGIDRHFFGLEQSIPESDCASPTLFLDPLFQRSKQWRLSTSTLPIPPGFGPVVSDGVGIGYFIDKNSIYFCVTCRKENNRSAKLSGLIDIALNEMKAFHPSNDARKRNKL